MCDSSHWTLAIICYPGLFRGPETDGRRFMILYFDSLGGSSSRAGQLLFEYLSCALCDGAREDTMAAANDCPGSGSSSPTTDARVFKASSINVPRQVLSVFRCASAPPSMLSPRLFFHVRPSRLLLLRCSCLIEAGIRHGASYWFLSRHCALVAANRPGVRIMLAVANVGGGPGWGGWRPEGGLAGNGDGGVGWGEGCGVHVMFTKGVIILCHRGRRCGYRAGRGNKWIPSQESEQWPRQHRPIPTTAASSS
jgi:hypothetical protein